MVSKVVNTAAIHQYNNFLAMLSTVVDLIDGDVRQLVSKFPDPETTHRIWSAPEREEIVAARTRAEESCAVLCRRSKKYEEILRAREWRI